MIANAADALSLNDPAKLNLFVKMEAAPKVRELFNTHSHRRVNITAICIFYSHDTYTHSIMSQQGSLQNNYYYK